jgi:hypothetical protein
VEADVSLCDELLIEEINLLGELMEAINTDTLHLVKWLADN